MVNSLQKIPFDSFIAYSIEVSQKRKWTFSRGNSALVLTQMYRKNKSKHESSSN